MLKQLIRKKQKSNNKGFGLIEVLVAVAIMSIVTIPLGQSFVTAAKVNNKSEVKLAAITVAENTMERAKALDLSEFTIDPDDGMYYIDEDQVDENGNIFNVRTIIDPTKYADINSNTYDLSTLDFKSSAKFEVPDTIYDSVANNERYYVEIEIKKSVVDGITKIVADVKYTVAHNGHGWHSVPDTVATDSYIFEGDGDGLKNIELTYATIHKVQLGGITVKNPDNVDVYMTFYQTATFSGRHDEFTVIEDEDKTTNNIPYTKINKINEGLWHDRYAYYVYTNADQTKTKYAPELLENAFHDVGNSSSSYSIDEKDTIMGVNVSVYEYINSADEDVKYANDSLLTFIDGSKFID